MRRGRINVIMKSAGVDNPSAMEGIFYDQLRGATETTLKKTDATSSRAWWFGLLHCDAA